METLLQDLRYGFRMLVKSPAFTTVAVLTLALGIGANTAIFTLVNALLLRQLPVQRPHELIVIGDPSQVNGSASGSPQTSELSYPLYRELLVNNEACTDILATGQIPRIMVATEVAGKVQPPERARGRLVSENYFSMLGIKPMLGRTFTAEDGASPGSDPAVVISHSYWMRRFNSDPDIVGKMLRVNGYPLTIIGVTPAGFTGEIVGDIQDVWVPMMMQAQVMPGRNWLNDVSQSWLLLIGRMKPGIHLKQAQASLQLTMQRIGTSSFKSRFRQDEQENLSKLRLKVSAGGRGLSAVRAYFERPLVILMRIVALVLLIACVNVANLLLARSSARQTEMAVRLAIGASPLRIARQLLTESVLLACAGGAVGILLASWGTRALVRLVISGSGPLPLNVTPNSLVLAFTAVLSLGTGMLFGLAPALRARRVHLSPALKEGTRGGLATGAPRPTAGKYLIVAQVALSVLVLFTSALLVRSLKKLQDFNTGYEREHLLQMRVDWVAGGYRGPRFHDAALQLLERLRHLPGVKDASVSEHGLFGGSEASGTIIAEGFQPQHRGDDISYYDVVGPDYFKTVGIPVILGRELGEQDTATSPRAVVINQAAAQFFFPGANPIGRRLGLDSPELRDKPSQVVGVVADIRDHDLRGPVRRRFYMPLTQWPEESSAMNYSLRTAGNPASVAESVRNVVREFDSNVPIMTLRTVNELVNSTLGDQIVMAQLSMLFAGLALALACVGLYGLMSYAVAGRTREIGVRMALGAANRTVLWLVLREALWLVMAGIAVGIPLGIASSRVLRSMLFEVTGLDPVSLGASMLLLGMVAVLAAYIPARRASSIDPMVALRYE